MIKSMEGIFGLYLLFCVSALATAATDAAFASTPVPRFQKVVLVILENTSYESALAQPFLRKFAQAGALLTKSSGVAHPSQPNYIALTSGNTFNVMTDGIYDLNVKNLADLLESEKKSWKVYAEDYPGKCFAGRSSAHYVRKHVPFISYTNIQKDPKRCANIVESTEFLSDLNAGQLPDFSLFVPNLLNDGHDTGVAYADRYLTRYFGPILADRSKTSNVLFIITFDEDEYHSMPQHIYTAFYGAGVASGTQSLTAYDHYSILKTLEAGFGLPSLGQKDATAKLIDDIWSQ